MPLRALLLCAKGTGSMACFWDKGAWLVCAVPKSWARPLGDASQCRTTLGTAAPFPGAGASVLPALRRVRAVLTQMTRFGEPMLEPGGEMEVSDVLLCCGGRKAEDM